MKNILIIFSAFLFCLTGCQKDDIEKKQTSELKSMFVEKNNNCSEEIKLYYVDNNNIKYYTNCLTKIMLIYDDKEVELKDVLEKDISIADKIIERLDLYDVIYDGGSKIYKSNENSNFTNTGVTIIKCNSMKNEMTENGNLEIKYVKDYYFGDSNFEFTENTCSIQKEG